MIGILLLLLVGLVLSAFFSGSETGFYRVTRVRLVMDAKSGKLISRILLWLINHMSVVVATVLIGNNIANYLVSLGLLLASQRLFATWGAMETLLPLLATPVLFVYGELLPKYMYYKVPYRLLNAGAPLMVLCTILFLPISFIVIALESISQRLLGNNSLKTGSTLERQELQRVLVEGQEAGILLPIQREIAQNLFTYGVRPVRQFAVPLRAIAVVPEDTPRDEIIKLASRMKQPVIGVLDSTGQKLRGCYLASDLLMRKADAAPRILSISTLSANASCIQALTQLQTTGCPLAEIVDAQRRCIGVIRRERLMSLLLSET